PTERRMHEAGRSTDWVGLATRTGMKHQHNFSFSGGNAGTKYYTSINYSDARGISLNDDFTRVNFRLNLEQALAPWLRFSTNTQFGRFDRSGHAPDFGRAFQMNPLAEAYDENGDLRLAGWEDSSVAFAKNPLSAINERNSDVT